jgi:hypothetical protein
MAVLSDPFGRDVLLTVRRTRLTHAGMSSPGASERYRMERERREATPHFERARMRRDLSADQAKKAAQLHSFNEASQAFRSPERSCCAVGLMCAGEIPYKEVSVMSDKNGCRERQGPEAA